VIAVTQRRYDAAFSKRFNFACLPPRFAKLPDEWAMKRRWRDILSGGFATIVLLAS
jgi:hypothetical protein